MSLLDPDTIKVGDRIRTTLPQMDELVASVRAHGVIQPIAITPERQLLAGARRLEACRILGVKVPVRFMAGVNEQIDALRVERDENEERVDFTLEERRRLADRLQVLEVKAAAERQAEGRAAGGRAKAERASGAAAPEADKPASDEEGRAAYRAAKAAGFASRREYARVADVLDAAEADPERFGALRDELNTTGKAAAVHRKLRQMQGGVGDNDSWSTPDEIMVCVHRFWPEGIGLDPCSNAIAIALGFVRARVAWTIDDDALAQPTWDVEPPTTVWYQPPYSAPRPLTERLVTEWDEGHLDEVLALVKLDTSTKWWAMLRDRAAAVVLLPDRVAHHQGPEQVKGSDFCSALLLLTRRDPWQRRQDLARAFAGVGHVLAPVEVQGDEAA